MKYVIWGFFWLTVFWACVIGYLVIRGWWRRRRLWRDDPELAAFLSGGAP